MQENPDLGNIVIGEKAACKNYGGYSSLLNIELAYLPDLLQDYAPELIPRLLARLGQPRQLSDLLVLELMAYSDWQAASLLGATVAHALLHTLETSWP